ncbi:MAG TPA: hypothetical protein VGT07_17145 [Steroidobacteraceae bacterium]|nr:hypothetical protein [Steroidobacteraceae bacterium]
MLSAMPTTAAAQVKATAAPQPRSAIVITYRSGVADRPSLRREAQQVLVPRLQAWRRDGTIAGYQLLFNSFVDAGTWDLMAIIDFKDFNSVERWRDIERSSPGGLTARGLRVLTPSSEYLMDVVQRSQAADSNGRPGVFLVIPYVFSPTPLERYLQYAHGYILPETEGWMRHGNISGYGLYVNRFYPDEPVQSLLVLEYKDFDALSNRETVVEQTRRELSADPAWKSWSDAKGNEHIRTEKQAVIAEQLAAH